MKMNLYHYNNIDDATEEEQFRNFWYPGWGDDVRVQAEYTHVEEEWTEEMRAWAEKFHRAAQDALIFRAHMRERREHYKDYYHLQFPDGYYAPGENRRTVNTLRRMIRAYVKEQEEQGRTLECSVNGDYWLLHEDVLRLIADHLNPPLDELLRQADEDRDEWRRITREQGSAASFLFGNKRPTFATTHPASIQDALRLFNLSNDGARRTSSVVTAGWR